MFYFVRHGEPPGHRAIVEPLDNAGGSPNADYGAPSTKTYVQRARPE